MNGWPVVNLGAIVDVTDYVANGSFESLRVNVTYSVVPEFAILVRLVDYNRGWAGPFTYVDKGSYEFLKKSSLAPGDVVVANVGSVGTVFRVPDLGMPMTLGPNAVLCRPRNRLEYDRDYMYYFLSSPAGQSLIESIVSGSAQPKFNKTGLRQLQVPVPPIAHQRAIAHALGALDDKISANTKLGSLLGEHVDASFASIVGPWRERVPLGDLVSVTKGVSYRSADLLPSSTALVTLKSIQRDGGYSPRGLKSFAGAFKKVQQIHAGELAVAQTDLTQAADVVGRAVRVPASSAYNTLVASLDIAIVRPNPGVESEFVLGVMRDGRFTEHCKSRTSGTTVLHLAKDAIQSFPAPEVSSALQTRFAAAVGPAHRMRDAVARESEVLTTTRDVLLLHLMSGKIRVSDAEQIVGDVV